MVHLDVPVVLYRILLEMVLMHLERVEDTQIHRIINIGYIIDDIFIQKKCLQFHFKIY